MILEIQSSPGHPYFWRPPGTSGWGHLPCWWAPEIQESTRLLREDLLSILGIRESELNKAWILSSRGLVVQGQAIGKSAEKTKG